MRISLLFGPMCLAFRGSFDFTCLRTDPRGMTGSELGFIRIAEELQAAGHHVSLHTVAEQTEYNGMPVRKLTDPIEPCDVVLAINEPDLLRKAPTGAIRLCAFWLNDTSFCKVGFDERADLFLSPSEPHLEQVMTNLEWRQVERTQEFPTGRGTFVPDASKWVVLPLGCDPERYDARPGEAMPIGPKIPGRVISCSSPDRGLHHLLGAWPEIRRAVPHATLQIFYRLEPWLRGFDQTPWFPPIEPLRARANYVEECLRRFQEHGGMGVTLRDSVSRETIEREMAQAEVLAFPCDTTAWSEGFSVATLEGCAARACPIISDCDALGSVYAPLSPVPREPGWVKAWTARLIEALTVPGVRNEQNDRAYALASKLTWKNYAANLTKEIESRWPQLSPPTNQSKSSRSEPASESS